MYLTFRFFYGWKATVYWQHGLEKHSKIINTNKISKEWFHQPILSSAELCYAKPRAFSNVAIPCPPPLPKSPSPIDTARGPEKVAMPCVAIVICVIIKGFDRCCPLGWCKRCGRFVPNTDRQGFGSPIN